MAKYTRNSGKHWSNQEARTLRNLSSQNTPTRVIGLKLGRPVAGVYSKASEKNISLAPTNQSPYNRRKWFVRQRGFLADKIYTDWFIKKYSVAINILK